MGQCSPSKGRATATAAHPSARRRAAAAKTAALRQQSVSQSELLQLHATCDDTGSTVTIQVLRATIHRLLLQTASTDCIYRMHPIQPLKSLNLSAARRLQNDTTPCAARFSRRSLTFQL